MSDKTSETAWTIFYNFDGGQISLLLGQRDSTVKNAGQWGFMGGHVDAGETTKDAARREANEEAGITIGDKELIPIGEIHDKKYRPMSYYMVHSPQKFIPPCRSETSAFKWIPLDSLTLGMASERDLHKSVKLFLNDPKLLKKLCNNIQDRSKKPSSKMTSFMAEPNVSVMPSGTQACPDHPLPEPNNSAPKKKTGMGKIKDIVRILLHKGRD